MAKGFVPAYNFSSGSVAMARSPEQLIDQCYTRNENVYSESQTHLTNVQVNGIDAIRQALIARKNAQRVKHEKSVRKIRQ